jgi:hypothetical protein
MPRTNYQKVQLGHWNIEIDPRSGPEDDKHHNLTLAVLITMQTPLTHALQPP